MLKLATMRYRKTISKALNKLLGNDGSTRPSLPSQRRDSNWLGLDRRDPLKLSDSELEEALLLAAMEREMVKVLPFHTVRGARIRARELQAEKRRRETL